ncbi:MAG: FG-GAP repeat protein, partial [Planctomycetota bacterium]
MTDAGLRALFAAAMLGVGLTVTPAWSQCDGGEMTIEELLATDSLGYEQFGYAVAVSGNVALVGANEDDDLGSNSGSAYVFRFDGNGWTQEQKLLASDGAGGDMFGLSVALAGDVAVIGAPRNDDAGSNSGSAYVFRFDGDSWVEEQKLVAPDGASWDALGTSVGLSGGQVLAGA